MRKLRILLSNDDGVHAPGLHALYLQLKRLGHVSVVAPLEEKSTTGHSLTLHKPLRLLEIKKDFYGVNGSPADCVYLGIREVIKRKPDFVVSGINRGANLGQDVYYSGTVSAAREACMMGLPAMAVSLSIDFKRSRRDSLLHYDSAARLSVQFLRGLYARTGGVQLPLHTLINLNVPNLPLSRIKGFRFARQGFRHYGGSILKRRDHRGKDYYWVGGEYQGHREEPGTDCVAVEQNYASVTPLKLDTTDLAFLAALDRRWGQ